MDVAQRGGIRHQRCAPGVRVHIELAVEQLGLLYRAPQERSRVPLATAVRTPPALILELSADQRLARMAQDSFRGMVDELHPPARLDHQQAFLDGLEES